jgi:hypothetical protein
MNYFADMHYVLQFHGLNIGTSLTNVVCVCVCVCVCMSKSNSKSHYDRQSVVPGVYSASKRVPEAQRIMILGSNVRRVHRADNLTAICEPIVYTMWDP